MDKLIEILEKFKTNREDSIKKEDWKEKSAEEKYSSVADWFNHCAEEILCGGYFLVNGRYIIDLGCIELYYHEEDGSIKDYIMYHSKAHSSKSELCKDGYPYFKIGSFNLHQSGVDITFENNDNLNDKYRASFLIRSYRVLKTNNGDYPIGDKTKYDNCSTHIFDDMFCEGISFGTKNRTTIEWKELKSPKNEKIKKLPRKNVAKYLSNNVKDDKIEGDGRLINKNDYTMEINKKKNDSSYIPKYINIGKKYYKQDMRPWQFKLESINNL